MAACISPRMVAMASSRGDSPRTSRSIRRTSSLACARMALSTRPPGCGWEAANAAGRYDIAANVTGGGPSGQAVALCHGIARALERFDSGNRPALKRRGLLTRDSRKKERKKYGQRGARARFQFSKR